MTKTLPNNQASLRDELKASFIELKQQSALHIVEVALWFEQNINKCSKALHGTGGRRVSDKSEHRASLKHREDKLLLEVEFVWRYEKTKGTVHNLESFMKLLPDVEIQQITTDQQASELCAILRFDLAVWQGLATILLYENLYVALACDDAFEVNKQKMREEACLLLEKFYPNIPFTLVEPAVNLGILDTSPEGFGQWLNELNNKQHVTPTSPPTDLSM